jgi:predicted transcriptional regulator
VNVKQTSSTGQELVSLSVRVPKDTADRLKVIADRSFRPVAAEMRRLIQEHVDRDQEAA